MKVKILSTQTEIYTQAYKERKPLYFVKVRIVTVYKLKNTVKSQTAIYVKFLYIKACVTWFSYFIVNCLFDKERLYILNVITHSLQKKKLPHNGKTVERCLHLANALPLFGRYFCHTLYKSIESAFVVFIVSESFDP